VYLGLYKIYERFEETKVIIKYNELKIKDKSANKDLQKTRQKTKD
jgi:hypothetical protein